LALGIATALAEPGANVVMADIQKTLEQAAHGLSVTNTRVCGEDRISPGAILARSWRKPTQFRQAPHRLQQMPAADAGHQTDRRPPRGDWEFVIGVNIVASSRDSATRPRHPKARKKKAYYRQPASVGRLPEPPRQPSGPYSMSKYAFSHCPKR